MVARHHLPLRLDGPALADKLLIRPTRVARPVPSNAEDRSLVSHARKADRISESHSASLPPTWLPRQAATRLTFDTAARQLIALLLNVFSFIVP